jgi:uncharacterized protein YbjT (DUF2867 family)
MYRSQEEAGKAPSGKTTVIADFADPASLGRALEGIESVFLVCWRVPQLVELEDNVVRACQEHGVRHLVQASAFGAGQFDKSFPERRAYFAGTEACLKFGRGRGLLRSPKR